VRCAMNDFFICVGAYYALLSEWAKEIAAAIGKVHVDVGNTACKVPVATDYIKKIEDRNAVGEKAKDMYLLNKKDGAGAGSHPFLYTETE
jgi:hypothetical protein